MDRHNDISSQAGNRPRALIVEDDPFVLIDMEDMLDAIGLNVAGRAVSKSMALELIAADSFDVATIDYDLAGETSEEIAESLRAKGVPFVLVSGKVPYIRDKACFTGFPALEKPVTEHQLAETLQGLMTA